MNSNNAALRLVHSKREIIEGLGLGPSAKPNPQRDAVKGRRSLPPEMQKACKDGERTGHLTRLTGILVNQNRGLDEVVVLAHAWNRQNTPPLEDDKVQATCEGIWKTHQRNHPDEGAAGTNDGELLPLFDLEEARVGPYLATEPPKRQWLLENCLPLGKVGGLVAPGGTGKSQFLLQLGVSVAAGLPFLGFCEAAETNLH